MTGSCVFALALLVQLFSLSHGSTTAPSIVPTGMPSNDMSITAVVSTYAGVYYTSTGVFSGDGGPATSAKFNSPGGVWLNTVGEAYVSDNSNKRVRKIDGSGAMSTYFGTGTSTYTASQNGGAATSANVAPFNVCGDTLGRLYVIDATAANVRKVDTSKIVTLFAGGGSLGSASSNADNGAAATSAAFSSPGSCSVDTSGNVYLTVYLYYKVKKITVATNIINNVAGVGSTPTADTATYNGDGGPATSAKFFSPSSVFVNTNGLLYIVSTTGSTIRTVDPSTGIVTTFGGTGVGTSSSTVVGDSSLVANAQLQGTSSTITGDSDGYLFYATSTYSNVRFIDPNTVINRFAGTSGTTGYSGDGGPGTSALLNSPQSIYAYDGSIYVPEKSSNVLRRLMYTVPKYPSYAPTATASPSVVPSVAPSAAPSYTTTQSPTVVPSIAPTVKPTTAPSEAPTTTATLKPSVAPSTEPSVVPTMVPTVSIAPSAAPTTIAPSVAPTVVPTTIAPTRGPTVVPSGAPVLTVVPTRAPSEAPTVSLAPSQTPTVSTVSPSLGPSIAPSVGPTFAPSVSFVPTVTPTAAPSETPSNLPTHAPTVIPTEEPSLKPSVVPSEFPSLTPSAGPSTSPSALPTTIAPSVESSVKPTVAPVTVPPTQIPSVIPSLVPSKTPSVVPSLVPSATPSVSPTAIPSLVPSLLPSQMPISGSVGPSTAPSAFPITSAPSAAPTLDSVDITFNSFIYLHNVSVTVLNEACEAAVLAAVADTLSLSDDRVTYVSQEFIGTDSRRRRLSGSTYNEVMIEVNVWASTQDYTDAVNRNASYLYDKLKSVLDSAVNTTTFSDVLRNHSSACTAGMMYVNLMTLSDYTVVTSDDDGSSSGSDDDKDLSAGAIAGIVIGSFVGFLILAYIVFYFVSKKPYKKINTVYVTSSEKMRMDQASRPVVQGDVPSKKETEV